MRRSSHYREESSFEELGRKETAPERSSPSVVAAAHGGFQAIDVSLRYATVREALA